MRTIIRPIKNNPELSQAIGEVVAQQRRAYNWAVNQLNREPKLPLAASQRKGTDGHRSLCGRFTQYLKTPEAKGKNWRQVAGYRHIHDAGIGQAHRANDRKGAGRDVLIQKIESLLQDAWESKDLRPRTKSQQAKRTRDDRHLARLIRQFSNRRRTLAYRTRKHGSQTLEVDNNQILSVRDKYTIELRAGGKKLIIRLATRLPLSCSDDPKLPPKDRVVRSLRLVQVRGREYSARTPLKERHYEVHIALKEPEPPMLDLSEVARPEQILGVDVGVKRHWSVSSDDAPRHYHGPYAKHKSQPRRMQTRTRRKSANSRRRRDLEKHRRKLLRKRNADKRRVFNDYAIQLAKSDFMAVAIEGLNFKAMTASARGSKANPGKSVAAKRGLNRSMAEAGLSDTLMILAAQFAKQGKPVWRIRAAGSSQTCPRCGDRHKGNRESQAVFLYRKCGFRANADCTAAVIIRNRAFFDIRRVCHGEIVYREDAPTGWETQPSRQAHQPRLFDLANKHRPIAGAEGAFNSKRRGTSRKAGYGAQERVAKSSSPGAIECPSVPKSGQ